jgi:Flp pilus assembly pilin Flp
LQKELQMVSLFKRCCLDERGASATEYAMLIVFIALAVAVGSTALGSGINNLFQDVSTTLTGVTIPTP